MALSENIFFEITYPSAIQSQLDEKVLWPVNPVTFPLSFRIPSIPSCPLAVQNLPS